ncbi:ROK family protein [Microbacterium sp. Marseille-Q6965]|uniref:ROK family protein n=1 Tax=Microbacterium sp. Marseille-Q6965 TaxID=2965072 RepID=UPI0021B81428|nr:ROK family protein [Microbacterium sp. Marseille-Q6965]
MTARVGVDVGGTKVEAVAVGGDGAVLARVRRDTIRGEEGVLASVLAAIGSLAEGRSVTGIGIGTPGQVQGGIVRNAVNLGVTSLDLAAAVSARSGAPVRVENDVNAAALGVHAMRGGEAPLAYLNLGTGIAAGIVIGGTPLRGADGTAGEIGHVPVDPRGRECPCGQRGCIETLAAGWAIAARWGRHTDHPVREVFAAAAAGDARAVEIRDDLVRGAAAAVRVLALAVDPAVVVLGGGVSRVGEPLLSAVRAELRGSAAASPFLSSLRLEDRVELLPPDANPGALGAALLAG